MEGKGEDIKVLDSLKDSLGTIEVVLEDLVWRNKTILRDNPKVEKGGIKDE